MNNKKLLIAAGLLAASSTVLADYTAQGDVQLGEASLSSVGGCKFKRTKFPNAKYGVFVDSETQEIFEGVVSSDGKLLAKFGVQNFMLSDISSSTARQDYRRQVSSYTLLPDSLNYLIEQNNCSFMPDVNGTPIIQTNPAQNVIKLSAAKLRSKTNDWSINHQTNMSISYHAITLQEKNCSSPVNCSRTGVISSISFTFKHKTNAIQPDRLFILL